MSTLLRKISDRRQREVIRWGVNQFLNHPEGKLLKLQGANIGPEGMQVLMTILEDNPSFQTLDTLNLYRNQIGEAGVKALAGALEKNLNLLQLNLGYNQIGDAGALVLAETLEKNPNLQQLDLTGNRIGDKGVQALAEALKKNHYLQLLDLSWNQIGDTGANALAGALEKNLSLLQLDLGNNQIGDASTNALAGALEKNLNLLQLNLSENQLGNSGTLALAGALEKNLNLLQLDLQINDNGLRIQIATLLQANRQIAAIFRKQTEDLKTFIQSHENQLITEEENFLSFQKEIERQHEKLKILRASLEEIIHQGRRTDLSEGYRKKIEAIEANLNRLLLRAFEDKLALLSKGYFSEESSEERKLTLGHYLYEIWTSFFGFQYPDWLKEKERSLLTFCLLLSIAEGKEEASFDPPGMIFQRICQLNQPKR